MAIEKWFNQTHNISYSTMIDTAMFYCLTSEYIIHYVLANLLCQSWVLLAIESCLSRQTVSYTPQILIQLCFIIQPEKKSDTIC